MKDFRETTISMTREEWIQILAALEVAKCPLAPKFVEKMIASNDMADRVAAMRVADRGKCSCDEYNYCYRHDPKNNRRGTR